AVASRRERICELPDVKMHGYSSPVASRRTDTSYRFILTDQVSLDDWETGFFGNYLGFFGEEMEGNGL
ncbi:MAG: hypothetical protein AAGA58_18300, partial [Verrucomicrobiota bacterium]